MQLSDYLEQSDQRATALAEQLGVAVSTITRAARGEVLPSRGLMREIFKATGGQVTPNDFVGVITDGSPSRRPESRAA